MSERATGSIYDLGYRRYEGQRLGTQATVFALYVQGLRAVFGLGRRARSKIFPIGLVIVALAPAVVQVMIASVGGDEIEVFRAEDYYSLIQIILALFAAVVAPELLGRDQRHATLPLYFSRGLSRQEYALARYGALATAMLALTLLPQALMFVGNALVGESFGDYVRAEWKQIGPIVASGLLLSAFVAAIAAVIAAQTPRRAFATVGVLAPFVLLSIVSGALTSSLDNIVGRLGVFLSPFEVMNGFTYWLFGAAGSAGDDPLEGGLAQADFAGGAYFLFAVVATAIGAALLAWGYGRKSL